MRAAVIGGTPEALVVALAMTRAGVDVTVYAGSGGLRQRGMGVVLGREGRAALNELGVQVPGTQLFGERLGVLRDDLLQALHTALPPEALRWGRFAGFSARGDVRVDGQVLDADVYIGADGAGSPLRRALFPHGAESTMQMTEVECVFAPDTVLDLVPGLDIVPVAEGRVTCTLRNVQATDWRDEEVTRPGDARAISAMQPAAAMDARIWHTSAFVPPATGAGRVVLVGDAADPRGAFAGADLDASILDGLQVVFDLLRAEERAAV